MFMSAIRKVKKYNVLNCIKVADFEDFRVHNETNQYHLNAKKHLFKKTADNLFS